MTKIFMITMPRYEECIEWQSRSNLFARLKIFVRAKDIHKWIIAKETGANGYEHIQARIRTSETFECLKEWFPCAHIEEASDTWEYERKEGQYITSEDTRDIQKVRFGTLTHLQNEWLRFTKNVGDREIITIYDPKGCNGKSWFVNHLYERGMAYYVSPHQKSAIGIIQDVCSGYRNEGLIVIDIPRSWKWTEDLYTSIETIRDGLVRDPRYSSTTRNIRGSKILVFTNTLPKLDKLSEDRWKIWEIKNGRNTPLS